LPASLCIVRVIMFFYFPTLAHIVALHSKHVAHPNPPDA
jgi:hypothetical protein